MTDTTLTAGAAGARSTTRIPSLRTVLVADAVLTAGNGAAYLILAGPLGDLLGLEVALLRGVGAFLLAFAVLVAVAARQKQPRRGLVLTIAEANVAWALGSVIAAVAGWGSPDAVGTGWMVAQALVVGGLGVLQAIGGSRLAR